MKVTVKVNMRMIMRKYIIIFKMIIMNNNINILIFVIYIFINYQHVKQNKKSRIKLLNIKNIKIYKMTMKIRKY